MRIEDQVIALNIAKATASATVLCLLSCTSVETAPHPPQIEEQAVQSTGFVDIDLDKAQAGAPYKDYVSVHPEGKVQLPFKILKDGTATQAYAIVDGTVDWHSKIDLTPAPGSVQTGTVTATVRQPGAHTMRVRTCMQQHACIDSEQISVQVFDTLPAFADDLPDHSDAHHRPYMNTTGSVVGTYFAAWSIYKRQFDVSQVPLDNLTHLMYAFTGICGGEGINDALKRRSPTGYDQLQTVCRGLPDFSVVIADASGAVAMKLPGQSEHSPLRGIIGQMMAAKKRHPDLKVVASLGGAASSDPFFHLGDPNKRHTFIQSLEQFLRTWKFFDGIDIDWEYPGATNKGNPAVGGPEEDGANYVILVQELRAMLDRVGRSMGKTYTLTSAIFSKPEMLNIVDYKTASQYVDVFFDMTYDFYGAWDLDQLGHHTALYAPSGCPEAPNAHRSIQTLLQQGVDPHQLAIGVAMYGRGWTGVAHFADASNPFTGIATGPHPGQWARGVLDYKKIAQDMVGPNGTGIHGYLAGYDSVAEAAYVFKADTGDLITYDSPRSVRAKSEYARAYGLGGVFSWVIDADNGDLLNAAHEGLGHPYVASSRRISQRSAKQP